MTEAVGPTQRGSGLGDAGERVRENLRVLRHARNLSLRDLAGRLTEMGWPILPSGVHGIESGGRKVTVGDLAALAAVLDVADPWTLATEHFCPACKGFPPVGFTCNTCGGTSTATPATSDERRTP